MEEKSLLLEHERLDDLQKRIHADTKSGSKVLLLG